MVYRVFIEKCRRSGYPSRIESVLREILPYGTDVPEVRFFCRYDIEGVTFDEFKMAVRKGVFSNQGDTIYWKLPPEVQNGWSFAIESIPGQYNAREDAAEQVIQSLTGKEPPTIRFAEIINLTPTRCYQEPVPQAPVYDEYGNEYFYDDYYNYDGNSEEEEMMARLQEALINEIECEEGDMSSNPPAELEEHYKTPDGIEILRDFNGLNEKDLLSELKDRNFAMSFEDLKFCQHYFRDIEKRSPTIAELKTLDTYWSDHCRHATFNTTIVEVTFEPGEFETEFEAAFAEYLADKLKVEAAKKAEAERLAAEKAEQERIAAEKAEAERIAAEEAARIAEEKAKAEAELLKKAKRREAAQKGAATRARNKAKALEKFAEEYAQKLIRDEYRQKNNIPLEPGETTAEEYYQEFLRNNPSFCKEHNVQPKPKEIPAAEIPDEKTVAERIGAEKPVTLMDLGTIAAKSLKLDGVLKGVEETDEINACSIQITADVDGRAEDWLVMFKNETHNHPTEIEPFGGAATCLGGAIRDPLSGRAYVYQAMRVTGAADPRTPLSETLPGKLPQRKIVREAARGYSSYGNQIGLATGQVYEFYCEGYMAKRMEIGAVIGAAPKENVIREQPAAGDLVLLVGGRTGRDGIGGATGSSKVHTTDSMTTCGAEVQKGNPLTERKIQRLFRNPNVSRLIKRCNDFGAGGVAVAVGELAQGLEINLDAVRKKYEGLDGTELAISESQERMAVVVSPENVDAFIKFADQENLEAYVIAEVTEKNRLVMNWRGEPVISVSRNFLDTNGIRQFTNIHVAQVGKYPRANLTGDLKTQWLKNLLKLNVCSQKGLAEQFDSTVGAGTVLMPFGGRNQLTPAEGMVAKLPVQGETKTATAMTFGFDAEISAWSPYHGAIDAVTSSLAKLTALGADFSAAYLTFQEYFERLGDSPEKWGKPFAALLGAYKAQKRFGVAAIGGKDSMSGTYENLNVPPTLVSFAVAVVDADWVISQEFKSSGNKVYLIQCVRDQYNVPEFRELKRNFAAIHKFIGEAKIISAMSVGIGGVAEAVSKMAIGNDVGFRFAKNVTLAAGGNVAAGSKAADNFSANDFGGNAAAVSKAADNFSANDFGGNAAAVSTTADNFSANDSGGNAAAVSNAAGDFSANDSGGNAAAGSNAADNFSANDSGGNVEACIKAAGFGVENISGGDVGGKFAQNVELFEKNYGSLIVEAAPGVELDFELLGETIDAPQIELDGAKITLEEIKQTLAKTLEQIFPTRVETPDNPKIEVELYQNAAARPKPKISIAEPRVFIPVFPGTNCEYESARCWRFAGAKPNVLVVRNLTPAALEETFAAMCEEIRKSQIIMFPGGFSGGDEPDGAGKFIAAICQNQRVSEEIMNLLQKRDGLILGICNGFQALMLLGLLPYGEIHQPDENSPVLTYNSLGRHVSQMVRTRVSSNLSPWLAGNSVGDIHTIAVSHGEGRFVANDEWLKKLAANGQIATQYVDFGGNPTNELPFNPNGSYFAIEGITSADGRIFGKMGHSERIGDNVCKNVPGNKNQHIFEAGVNYFR